MKTLFAAAFAALLAAVAAPAPAQSPASANVSTYKVAVVDINYIFKNYQKFRAAMDGMKGSIQSIDAELKGEQQKILQAEEQKKQYKAGSAEYKQLDEQIVKMKADLQVEMTQRRKEIVEREAKILYYTYQEVQQAITHHAKQQSIGVVFGFNGEPADPNNRESIMRSLNKPVHYHDKVDITPDVLALLNRAGQQQAQRSAQQPARR